MEQIGTYVATITTAAVEERLRALAPLGLAIALFLADIESSNDVSLLLTMLEQAIVSIAATGRALALNQLREIASAMENYHCRACRLYCIYEGGLWQSALPCTLSAFNIYCTSNWAHSDMPIGTCTHIVDAFVEVLQTVLVGAIASATSLVFLPTWGTIDGDLWIREIAYNCQLVYNGARELGDAIASYYWVLVLPDRFIDALVQGEALDVSMFPQHQLNPCLTLQTSLSKCLHWCRQGVLQEQDTLSVLFWKPELSRTIGCMKTRSGTGGQLQWHNCSYISATYCGVITGIDGVVRLSAQELDSAFALRLQVSLRQAIGGVLQDAFQTGRSTVGVHRHLRYPLSFCDILGVPALSLLNSHGIEARTYSDHLCDWTEELPQDSSGTSEPKRVHIEAPRGIEVIVKHT